MKCEMGRLRQDGTPDQQSYEEGEERDSQRPTAKLTFGLSASCAINHRTEVSSPNYSKSVRSSKERTGLLLGGEKLV